MDIWTEAGLKLAAFVRDGVHTAMGDQPLDTREATDIADLAHHHRCPGRADTRNGGETLSGQALADPLDQAHAKATQLA